MPGRQQPFLRHMVHMTYHYGAEGTQVHAQRKLQGLRHKPGQGVTWGCEGVEDDVDTSCPEAEVLDKGCVTGPRSVVYACGAAEKLPLGWPSCSGYCY